MVHPTAASRGTLASLVALPPHLLPELQDAELEDAGRRLQEDNECVVCMEGGGGRAAQMLILRRAANVHVLSVGDRQLCAQQTHV